MHNLAEKVVDKGLAIQARVQVHLFYQEASRCLLVSISSERFVFWSNKDRRRTMFVWTLRGILNLLLLDVCAAERHHWRFAHTAGGLPSFVIPSFIVCVLSLVISQEHIY